MIKKFLIIVSALFFFGVMSVYLLAGILSAPNQKQIKKPLTGLPFENVVIQTKRGNVLHGWFLQGEPSKGGILLMHGVRSNRLQMVDRAEWLYQRGYSVLLFDFQAHGESHGEHITFGYLESDDAIEAYYYLNNKLETKKIGVIGVSLGGASALLSPIAQKADALVIESVYPTIEEAVANRISMRLGDPGKYLTPLLLWQIELRLGFDANILRPIEKLHTARSPILIIGGAKDMHTTKEETLRMYEHAKDHKSVWLVPGAIHQDIYRFDPQSYHKNVGAFLNKYL